MKTVYTSADLCRHPETFIAISEALAKSDVPHHSLSGSNNIWLRDFMPVPTQIGLVKFKYDAYGYRRSQHMKVPDSYWDQFKSVKSVVFLDGGNVEEGEEYVLMCDMVFRKNPHMSKIKLISELEFIFKKEIIFLPCEPDDTLGHVDGTARFLGRRAVLINDYSSRKSRSLNAYQRRLEKSLSRAGMQAIPMPYAHDQCPNLSKREFKRRYPFSDDYNPAIGYYINYLELPNIILVPQFGINKDCEATMFLSIQFPGRKIFGIPCFDVGMCGGAVNCITWTN